MHTSLRKALSTDPSAMARYVAVRKRKWANGDRSPWAATLKLTWDCNLSCGHCFWKGLARGRELSTEDWKREMDRLAAEGCVEVVLEGGEPTLRPDFYELVEYAKEVMVRVNVVSNGQRPIKALGINRLYISVEGTKATHDRLRGSGAFERLDRTVSAYVRKEELVILLSVWDGNKNELMAVMDHFEGSVAGFWFSFIYQVPGIHQVGLSNREKMKIAQRLIKLKKKYPILNSDLYLKSVGRGLPCRDWLLTTVLADGTRAEKCYPRLFGGRGCEDCDLACYREIDAGLFPEEYS